MWLSSTTWHLYSHCKSTYNNDKILFQRCERLSLLSRWLLITAFELIFREIKWNSIKVHKIVSTRNALAYTRTGIKVRVREKNNIFRCEIERIPTDLGSKCGVHQRPNNQKHPKAYPETLYIYIWASKKRQQRIRDKR